MLLLHTQKPSMVSYCQQNKIRTFHKTFKIFGTLVLLSPPLLFSPVLPKLSLILAGMNFQVSVPCLISLLYFYHLNTYLSFKTLIKLNSSRRLHLSAIPINQSHLRVLLCFFSICLLFLTVSA